jgi:hypothetical protein
MCVLNRASDRMISLFSVLFVISSRAEYPIIPFVYPLFDQCNSTYGGDIMEPPSTICEVGCLMSSVAMALNGRMISLPTAEADPGSLNKWLRNNGGYTNSSALEETVVPKIDSKRISWVGSFKVVDAKFVISGLQKMARF